MKEGVDLNIRVGCPNMIERVENHLLSYGNEMTNKNIPQDCGLGKFCSLDVDLILLESQLCLDKEIRVLISQYIWSSLT